MQRTDGQYLYTVGHQVHAVGAIQSGASYSSVLGVLWTAQTSLEQFLSGSIYQMRYCLHNGQNLLAWIKHVADKAFASRDLANDRIEDADLAGLKSALSAFENNLASEFAQMDSYLVAKKGGYDTRDLIDNGASLFQPGLARKVPGAIRDIKHATRCIAFELPTAAGFHLHRANESVLHAYFDAVRGTVEHPKDGNRNMGQYVSLMEKNDLGEERVRSALKDLKNLHRNPLIHPDHDLETVDEAIDLLGAIRAAVGAMLPAIPEPAGPLLAEIFPDARIPAPPVPDAPLAGE
jgi:hypothetical protein